MLSKQQAPFRPMPTLYVIAVVRRSWDWVGLPQIYSNLRRAYPTKQWRNGLPTVRSGSPTTSFSAIAEIDARGPVLVRPEKVTHPTIAAHRTVTTFALGYQGKQFQHRNFWAVLD
jgi:hypothetical protein